MAQRYDESRQDSSTLPLIFVVAAVLGAAGCAAGMGYEASSARFSALRMIFAG